MAAEGIRISSGPTTDATTEIVKAQNETRADIKAVSAAEKLLEQKSSNAAPKDGSDKLTESDPGVHNDAPVTTSAEQKDEPDVTKEPQPGEKRAYDTAVAPAAENQAHDTPIDETSKKQKTDADKPVVNSSTGAGKGNTATPAATNGEKRKPGRPKKTVKDFIKKLTPRSSDGIGSRTRSRAKVSE